MLSFNGNITLNYCSLGFLSYYWILWNAQLWKVLFFNEKGSSIKLENILHAIFVQQQN